MKKKLCILLLMAVAVCSANAQNPPQKIIVIGDTATAPPPATNVEGPQIEFDKMVHDYGQIGQGDYGECEFKFKNAGTEPLVVINARGSCGCVTPSWPNEPIMPGKEGVIKVSYNTNTIGSMAKTVTVYSNAKSDRVSLRLAGNVNPK